MQVETTRLWFRQDRELWESHDRILHFPTTAYLSERDARNGMLETEMSMSWETMERRIIEDIRATALA